MQTFSPKRAILPFKGYMGTSYCQVNIYDLPTPVVIVSELKANQGTSAVNCIERVALNVVKEYELNPENCIFIHHCPKGEGMFFGMEDFHEAPIKWNGEEFKDTGIGRWKLLTRDEVEQLIGCYFEN
ncbi:MAG: hypothetical protein AB4206_20410 [Xenococcaceae cyanobacterium]